MPRLIVKLSFAPGFLASVFLIAGCGDQPAAADKSSPPVAGADASSPDTKNADPGSTPAAAPKAAPAVLEDVRQFAQVLDLGKLPVPSGGTLGETSPTRFHASVPLAVPAAVEFYVGKLDALGWKKAGPKTMETVIDAFAQLQLGKDGYLLSMTILPSDPKISSVEIEQRGDLDARTLPRLDGAEDQYSDHGSSLYFTTVKFDKAVDEMRRRLKAAGWQEYDRAFSQKADRRDAADLLFRKKAYSLGVSISIPPADPAKTAVQCHVTTLARDMPAPADAGHVEIEDSRWIMMCDTPGDMAAAADYYRKTMKEVGFPDAPKENSSDNWRTLSFESPDHDLVLITLQPGKEKDAKVQGTKVKLEGYSAAFREAMKKALTADKLKHEALEKAAAEDKAARAKAFKQESDRQDKLIESAIGAAVKSATQSMPSGDSKKIEDDMKAKMQKALQDAGIGDVPKPDAKAAK